jgi:carbon monoxide dehydrogenase subunit G
MANWAASFPDHQSFEVVDDKVSRWTVKVKLGSLTRTAQVKVTRTEWGEPTRIAFTLEGETEPITGSGSFDAAVGRDGSTDVRIGLAVAGFGSMAPAMEAMSRPVLPRLGTAFAEVLRRDIEAAARPAEAVPGRGAGRATVRRAREPLRAGARTLLGPADTLARGPAVGGGGTGGPGGARRERPRAPASQFPATPIIETDLDDLSVEHQHQIAEAVAVIRKTRQVFNLGMPAIQPPDADAG